MLRRLLNALPRAVIFPAVIETTNTVPFNPTEGKLCAAMGAAKADDVGCAARAAIESKLFAHDSNRRRLSRFESFRHIDRLPKPSHVLPGQSGGAGMDEIRVVNVWLKLISGHHCQAKLLFSLSREPYLISVVFWSALPPTRCLLSETARSAPAGLGV